MQRSSTRMARPRSNTHGLEAFGGVTDVDAGAEWVDLEPFAEALASADDLGLVLGALVANHADALLLAKLKESATGNKPLLGADPTSPTKRLLQGVRLLVTPAVTVGTVWGLPKARVIVVRRQGVTLDVDKSAYFTSDRTAIKATMRVGFAFPHAAAIQKVALGS